ncbi:MAG TPA: glycosyltransferase family 2 protein [Cytophagaceae bacterium]
MGKPYVDGLVSVIIPVYNAAKFLDRTLQSIFSQTYKNVEIVLVDDCSRDNSSEIIDNYIPGHPEIVYHRLDKNMGAAVARNKALELARGRYVAFLDSDDEWLPEKLEKQLALMREKNVAFTYTAIEMIDEEGFVIKGKRKVRETVDYKFLLRNTMIATSSVVIDRYGLGDFKMPLRRGGQDYATWLQLLRDGTVAYGINEALVRYRLSRNSLSSNKFKSIKQVWEIQRQNEKIGRITASFHIMCFVFNAFKKYFF